VGPGGGRCERPFVRPERSPPQACRTRGESGATFESAFVERTPATMLGSPGTPGLSSVTEVMNFKKNVRPSLGVLWCVAHQLRERNGERALLFSTTGEERVDYLRLVSDALLSLGLCWMRMENNGHSGLPSKSKLVQNGWGSTTHDPAPFVMNQIER